MTGDGISHAGAGPESGSLPWPIELEPDAIRARFRWARAQGRPRYLWPEVEPLEWRTALRTISQAISAILEGGQGNLDGDPRALGIAGFTSGAGPLLGYWLERGSLGAAGPVRRIFELHLVHGRKRADIQASVLRRALATLSERDIEPVVLKSTATGALLFPEPGTRPGVDIDLVVPADRFATAEAALSSARFIRVGTQRSPRKSDWRSSDLAVWPRSVELLHSGGQYGIDLHSSLARDFFGIRRVTIEGDTETVDHPSGRIRILAAPARLAFHALHASEGLDNLTLIRLVEIVLMIRRDMVGSAEWAALLDMLERSGGSRFAWPAFLLCERLSPGSVDAGVLHALERAATPTMRRVLAGIQPADAQRLDVLDLRERFMWCRGPGEHARRLLHMLVPTPAGLSPARLVRLYGERAVRVLRGKVRLDRSPHPDD